MVRQIVGDGANRLPDFVGFGKRVLPLDALSDSRFLNSSVSSSSVIGSVAASHFD
jgi:hypothetical protein